MAFTSWLLQVSTTCSDALSDWKCRLSYQPPIAKKLSMILAVFFVLICLLGWYWSSEPAAFDVHPENVSTSDVAVPVKKITGDVITGALIQVASTLLDKQGGYLSNDISPPGIWLDNIAHWEYGVLIQVRDLSKAMREAFSRSQSQSTEDDDLVIAEPRFNFDNHSWILPSTESVYREGIDRLIAYRHRLRDAGQQHAQFYARADNLGYWLATVETRLGSLSQRLSA